MNKLLCIVGPTATGKTELALQLARKFNGDLISADSRQVYQGMDIGTGKDLPENFKLQTSNIKFRNQKIRYYTNGKIRMWGLDIVKPDQEFAVSEYVRYAIPVIKHIWQQAKLPIVVGGTGLYIRALLQPLTDIVIPPNQQLRKHLDTLATLELQKELLLINQSRFAQMNDSDKQNPRRLIRAIEISKWKKEHYAYIPYLDLRGGEGEFPMETLLIGLTSPIHELSKRIDERVEARVKQGIIDEIQQLLAHGYSWDLPALSGLGYQEWKEYFEMPNTKNQIPNDPEKLKNDAKERWKTHETQYAKRQITWFRKEKNIQWFDVTSGIPYETIARQIQPWYNS